MSKSNKIERSNFIETDMNKLKAPPPKKKTNKYKKDWELLHAENEDECYY